MNSRQSPLLGSGVQLHSVSVVIALGKRPVTFRTRKLSLTAPMVLQGGPCGRVGRRRTIFGGTPGHQRSAGARGPFVFYNACVPKTGVTMSTNSPDDRPERDQRRRDSGDRGDRGGYRGNRGGFRRDDRRDDRRAG